MLTELTRRCGACGELYQLGTDACTKCGQGKCTPPSEWPVGAKRFLMLLIITDSLATRLHAPEEQQLFWLLENAIRGRWYSGELVPYAATAADCYPRFIEIYRRWQEAGAPTEFTAIAQLRGLRS